MTNPPNKAKCLGQEGSFCVSLSNFSVTGNCNMYETFPTSGCQILIATGVACTCTGPEATGDACGVINPPCPEI